MCPSDLRVTHLPPMIAESAPFVMYNETTRIEQIFEKERELKHSRVTLEENKRVKKLQDDAERQYQMNEINRRAKDLAELKAQKEALLEARRLRVHPNKVPFCPLSLSSEMALSHSVIAYVCVGEQSEHHCTGKISSQELQT